MSDGMPRDWLNQYWGNVAEGRAPGGGHPMPQHKQSDAADRVRALKAQVDAQRQAVLDSIQNKIIRSNIIGSQGKGLIPMADLARMGITAAPGATPYGIDPKSLTPDERAALGLPPAEAPTASASPALAGIYGGG